MSAMSTKYERFDIFSQVQTELDDFFKSKIHIAGINKSESAKYLGTSKPGYEFSQWETLNLIELYYNSKFESGYTDSEGQRKVFLNICQFRADVASKQVDLDTKDFVFVPEDEASEYGALFLSKKFHEWSKKNYFGQLLNDVVLDYPKYGTAVVKAVGTELERVPLLNLRMQQDAKDLQSARYVIEEHKDMTIEEIQAMKGWDSSNLDMDYNDKATVYERYGRVPLSYYKDYMQQTVKESDYGEVVDCLIIMTLQKKKNEDGYTGAILFCEKITDRPYMEVHWKKQDGRWLGMGEVENQFENQVVRNMVANLRRRALYWSTKHVFQSSDTEVAKNLLKDVKDGDILKIMPNGNISPVAVETRNLAEFQSTEELWEHNSDQKSFTYEVATGEALPSGTPFRLGVMLSNSVNSHFALKRENLGIFFNKVIMELVLPMFKKQNRREHTILFASDDHSAEMIKTESINIMIFTKFKEELLKGQKPDMEVIRQQVERDMASKNKISFDVHEGFYDDLKASVTLVITGENINIEKKIETLTNFYTSLAQRGDPRAEIVLKRIMALTGEDITNFGAPQPPAAPQGMAQGGGQPAMPNMQGMPGGQAPQGAMSMASQ